MVKTPGNRVTKLCTEKEAVIFKKISIVMESSTSQYST